MYSKGALKTSYIAIAIVIVIIIAAIAIYFATAPKPTPTTPPTTTPTTPPPAKKIWRWAVPDPGSMGYRISTWPTFILRENMPDYDVIITPYSATTAAVKSFCKGEAETVWCGGFGAYLLYNFAGPFEGFKPEAKKMPLQTWFATLTNIYFLTTPEKAKEIRSWKDLEGRNVFLGPSGYITHQTIKKALELMGIKVNHVEMSTGMVADALRKGTIEVTYMYGVTSLPTWGKQVDIAIDLVAINPSEDEMEKMKELGIQIAETDPEKVFTQDVGVDKIYGVADPWGYWAGLDIPEEAIYQMLKLIEENIDKLKDPEFDYIKEYGFAEWQATAIKAVLAWGTDIPIHPGLAKYLKEKGLWESVWDKLIAK